MLKIIVNADDAGIDREVNEAIFDLMSRGKLRSTTLLANGPALNEALSRASCFPECSFGVHLNLSQFRPLTDEPGLAPLLDGDGLFNSDIIRRLPPSRALSRAVYLEWCAQVDRIRDAGVMVSHLDSHQHIHTCPALFTALKRLQKRCGIRKVRGTRNVYGPSVDEPKLGIRIKKVLWQRALRIIPPTTWTPDLFTNVRDFQAMLLEESWSRRRAVELMTHPGNPGSDDEVRYLRTDWLQQLPFAACLVGYNEVGNP